VKEAILRKKIANIFETVRYTAQFTTECGHKLIHYLSIDEILDDVT